MTSFGWKRKLGAEVCKTSSTLFEENTKDEDDLSSDIDWIALAPKKRIISLEDAVSKSGRLQSEGTVLAESERYWEAIKKWDEALHLTPLNSKVYEMKAQALMALNELYPAVSAARKVVEITPTWWVGHQTLGRARLNLGEVRLALTSFSTAVHLNPGDRELWEEDLLWAHSLLSKKEELVEIEEQSTRKSTLTVTELTDDDESVTVQTINNSGETSRAIEMYRGEKPDTVKKQKKAKLKSLPNNYVVMRDK